MQDMMMPETPGTISRGRPFLITLLMLWPWLCAGFGLFVIRDYRITMLMYGILCCALPIVLFRRRAAILFPLHFSVVKLLAIVLVMNIIILGLFQLTHFGIDSAAFLQHAAGIHLSLNHSLTEYLLYFVIVNPLLEEVFWRGFIYEEWKRILSPWPARLISSFCFGAWHWVIVQHFCPPFWAILLTLAVAIGGLLVTFIYDQTETLGAPILIHALGADLPLAFIVLWLLRGPAFLP